MRVSAFIEAWEFEAGLKLGPNWFRLRFDYADVEDRDPTTGEVTVRPRPAKLLSVTAEMKITVGETVYPAPPTIAVTLSPDVRSMYGPVSGLPARPRTAAKHGILLSDRPSNGLEFHQEIPQRTQRATMG